MLNVREIGGFRLTDTFGPRGNEVMAVKDKAGRSHIATGADDKAAMAAWEKRHA
jgi:hypothetical protein